MIPHDHRLLGFLLNSAGAKDKCASRWSMTIRRALSAGWRDKHEYAGATRVKSLRLAGLLEA
jgi:hypothetical protein